MMTTRASAKQRKVELNKHVNRVTVKNAELFDDIENENGKFNKDIISVFFGSKEACHKPAPNQEWRNENVLGVKKDDFSNGNEDVELEPCSESQSSSQPLKPKVSEDPQLLEGEKLPRPSSSPKKSTTNASKQRSDVKENSGDKVIEPEVDSLKTVEKKEEPEPMVASEDDVQPHGSIQDSLENNSKVLIKDDPVETVQEPQSLLTEEPSTEMSGDVFMPSTSEPVEHQNLEKEPEEEVEESLTTIKQEDEVSLDTAPTLTEVVAPTIDIETDQMEDYPMETEDDTEMPTLESFPSTDVEVKQLVDKFLDHGIGFPERVGGWYIDYTNLTPLTYPKGLARDDYLRVPWKYELDLEKFFPMPRWVDSEEILTAAPQTWRIVEESLKDYLLSGADSFESLQTAIYSCAQIYPGLGEVSQWRNLDGLEEYLNSKTTDVEEFFQITEFIANLALNARMILPKKIVSLDKIHLQTSRWFSDVHAEAMRLYHFTHVFLQPLEELYEISSIKVLLKNDGGIEDVPFTSQVDFANSYIGGGVLGMGCVQEEILFLIYPELFVSLLLFPQMEETESISVIGAKRYNNYSGYSKCTRFAGEYEQSEPLPRDSKCRLMQEIVAIDAKNVSMNPSLQYNKDRILREVRKLYSGFWYNDDDPSVPKPPIVSGWWGCGAFGGDKQLKAILQIAVAAMTQRDLVLCIFGETHMETSLRNIIKLLHKNDVTTGQLLSAVCKYQAYQTWGNVSLFDFLVSYFNQNL